MGQLCTSNDPGQSGDARDGMSDCPTPRDVRKAPTTGRKAPHIGRNGFTSRAVERTDSLGGESTDFRTPSVGLQPLVFFVHCCERCGYAGVEEQFSEETKLTPGLEGRIWDELAPCLGAETPTGSEKYEFAAKVATWQDESVRRIGELWLRAAWCCVDEDDSEAERYYRRYAAWAFEEALASYDSVDRDERALVTYLVGEQWRRIGDELRARSWFDRVSGEVTSRTKQQWVVDAARQQTENPQEWFSPALNMKIA